MTINVTISLEGTQARVQTALDKIAGTVTTGTITAGYLMYTDTSGGFTLVSTATAAASYQQAPSIWVCDFTQNAGNEVTGFRGMARLISDGNGSISAGSRIYTSTVASAGGLVSMVQWASWAPIVGFAAGPTPTCAASGTFTCYVNPLPGANV